MKNILYSSVVGSLMYVMVCTRPDIVHVVGMVSRYLSNPGKDRWEVVKWVMRYLCGLLNLKLTLGCKKPMLVVYTNSNIARSLDDRKSTTGVYGDFFRGNRGLEIKVAKVCCTLYYQRWVYNRCGRVKKFVMVEEICNGTRCETRKACLVLW